MYVVFFLVFVIPTLMTLVMEMYVRWVDEHSEEESWMLIESGLLHWEKTMELEDREAEEVAKYARLARTVLVNAKEHAFG